MEKEMNILELFGGMANETIKHILKYLQHGTN